MSTVELIVQKASALPDALQKEALHYVDYLLTNQATEREGREWTRFSAEQLALQYAEADCIYDQDFSDGQGTKRRPVLVVHDFGDADLLVVPVTSHAARAATDVTLSEWRGAGLKLPSTIRVEKLATIDKTCVVRKLGSLPAADNARVKETLAIVFRRILP
jgi:mRNA interferase MazF